MTITELNYLEVNTSDFMNAHLTAPVLEKIWCTLGSEYYAYVLLCVDNCLCISHNARKSLEKINKFFKIKNGSIADLDIYLGAKLRKTRRNNRFITWSMSASKYFQEAVVKVEEYLKKEGLLGLAWKDPAPLSSGYIPELDVTDKLGAEEASYFQLQIGILQWMVELG